MNTYRRAGWRRVVGLVGGMIALLGLVSTVSAAQTVEYQDGPRLSDYNTYLLGACADTGGGETVRIQYTVDNTDLTNPPDTGNGTKVVCALDNNTGCTPNQYWVCSVPAMQRATYKYRFYVTNASNQYYGVVSEQRSFTTGNYLAVEAERLSGTSVNPMGWVALAGALLSVALGGAWLTRRLRAVR